MFKVLSGGYGEYGAFRRGLQRAAEAGHRITINRLLLRETLAELPEQIEFAGRWGARLKLYDLLWTPAIADRYREWYVSTEEALTHYVASHPGVHEEESQYGRARRRSRWNIGSAGTIEVKWDEAQGREREPCASCAQKEHCLEAFGEYVRLTPDRQAYLCYLRRDIGVNVARVLESNGEDGGRTLTRMLATAMGIGEAKARVIIKGATLRLTVSNACNFHCAMPQGESSWCLEESETSVMPPIRRSTR